MENLKQHWNVAYETKDTTSVGWYEAKPIPSLDLIEESGVGRDARILDAGAGSSLLIDELLCMGYENIVAADISEVALIKAKDRLGEKARTVEWIVDDLTDPKELINIEPVDLWHDRAVLHFFTKENNRQSYLSLLKKLIKPGGHIVIGTFSLQGAQKCNGLDVKRYSAQMLAEFLGDEFIMISSFDHTFINPAGHERPYIYTLFNRQ